MRVLLRRFASDRSGASAIEYGLIAALISVWIIAALSSLGANLRTTFNHIAANVAR